MGTNLRSLGIAVLAVVAMAISRGAAVGEVTIVVSDPDGAAARVNAPIGIDMDTATAKSLHAMSGRADEKTLADVWAVYANPPKVTLTK